MNKFKKNIVIMFCSVNGSVNIPEALRPYMGGAEKIEPKK